MKRWAIRILLGCAAIVACVIMTLALFVPLFHGWSLRHTLLVAIKDASVIRVIEHSDLYDKPFDPATHYAEKIFHSVTLPLNQASKLREAFPLSLDYSFAVRTACIFSPHHRVEIVSKDGRTTILEICFKCGEIVLDGDVQRIVPRGWDRSLENFIVSLGMSPTPKEANHPQEPPPGAAH